jgi:hypothetical protein
MSEIRMQELNTQFASRIKLSQTECLVIGDSFFCNVVMKIGC